MIAAARGSVARASRFSSSVSVRVAQREDLVDLGGVEQVARALRGDLRVVVEDDRRRQHTSRGPSSPTSTGQVCVVVAGLGAAARPTPAGRAARRTRRRSTAEQRCARRPASGAAPRRGRRSGLGVQSVAFSTPDAQPDQRRTGPGSGSARQPQRRRRPASALAHDPTGRRRRASARPRGRRAARTASPARAGEQASDVDGVDLVLDGLVPADQRVAVDRRARRPVEAAARRPPRRSGPGPAGSAAARRPRRRRPGSTQALGLRRPGLAAVGLGVRPAAPARRTASAPGSSPPRPGRGRARSPRRARRRPPRGPASNASASRASLASRLLEQRARRSSSQVGRARPALKPLQARRACRGAAGSSRCRGSSGPSARARPRTGSR